MCCFSINVRYVNSTRIFARMSEPSRQALAYQMNFGSDEDVAMILPLPVPPGTGEDALKFINLKEYKSFFGDLRDGFPYPRSKKNFALSVDAAPEAGTLKVENVGSFEASFVPTAADFDRLDKRFSIPKATWDKIPVYADYGFAVFKLKKGENEAHPMAFTFPTRHPDKLFFPTVHIHDGEVHEKEEFDHQLYCQVNRTGLFALTRWQESANQASAFTKPEKSKQLIIADKHVYRREYRGTLDNEDVFLETA
ncbi:hypothetical protein HAHE_25570 [Haloferula helveola]|uniref:Uncharacterized protein n=1 Tax=Haloferula helveola TaxID=490095 RepID=A0ABM7RLH6_9BACT|nr:hypothetical protein HAHE_25570 [Haloferula helveola]